MADTVLDSLLYYGLFLGGVFQLICILAIVFIPPKTTEEFQDYIDGNSPTKGSSTYQPSSSVVHRKTEKKRKKWRKHQIFLLIQEHIVLLMAWDFNRYGRRFQRSTTKSTKKQSDLGHRKLVQICMNTVPISYTF